MAHCAAELFTVQCLAVEWLDENIYSGPVSCLWKSTHTCIPDLKTLHASPQIADERFPHLTWMTILGTVVDATGSHSSPEKEFPVFALQTNEDIEDVNTTTKHTDNIFGLSQTVSRNQVKHK